LLSISGCNVQFQVSVFLQSIHELLKLTETWGFAISFTTCQSETISVEGCCTAKAGTTTLLHHGQLVFKVLLVLTSTRVENYLLAAAIHSEQRYVFRKREMTRSYKSHFYREYFPVWHAPCILIYVLASKRSKRIKNWVVYPVAATGTRSPRIAYRQSAINNSLEPKPTPKPKPNPTVTQPQHYP